MEGWAKAKRIAKYTGVSERTLRSWLKNGLKYSKIGGIVLIRFRDADEFIEKFRVESDVDLIVSGLERFLGEARKKSFK